MDYSGKSILLFDALNSKRYKLNVTKPHAFNEERPFDHPPCFRFRYEKVEKHDVIYELIKQAVVNFKGNVQWTLVTTDRSTNFLLLPKVFSKYLEIPGAFYSDYIERDLGSSYQVLITDSIEDIPNLASEIKPLMDRVSGGNAIN